MKILIEIELSDTWGSEEELSVLSDDTLKELMYEDTMAMLDDATKWTFIRYHR